MHPRAFSIIVIGRINSNTIVEGHSVHATIICSVVLIKKRGVMLKRVGFFWCRFRLDFDFLSSPLPGLGVTKGEGREGEIEIEAKSAPEKPDRLQHYTALFIKTTLQMIVACTECPSTIVLLFILPMTMIEKARGCIWR